MVEMCHSTPLSSTGVHPSTERHGECFEVVRNASSSVIGAEGQIVDCTSRSIRSQGVARLKPVESTRAYMSIRGVAFDLDDTLTVTPNSRGTLLADAIEPSTAHQSLARSP